MAGFVFGSKVYGYWQLNPAVNFFGGTFAWHNRLRRLRTRYEKPADIQEAFLALGCILIGWKFLVG